MIPRKRSHYRMTQVFFHCNIMPTRCTTEILPIITHQWQLYKASFHQMSMNSMRLSAAANDLALIHVNFKLRKHLKQECYKCLPQNACKTKIWYYLGIKVKIPTQKHCHFSPSLSSVYTQHNTHLFSHSAYIVNSRCRSS